ncbi:hypothetical protein AALA24_09835 [Anaerovoracaceae bacterium 42-11]
MIREKNLQEKLQEILQIFPCVMEDTLLLYMKKNLAVSNPSTALSRLIYNERIYKDEYGYCYLIKGEKCSINTACAFAVYQRLIGKNNFYIDPAKYPFDYIISADGRLYLLMDFAEDGISRLGYEQRQCHPEVPKEAEAMPIIMIINRSPEDIPISIRPVSCIIARVNFSAAEHKIRGINFYEEEIF